MGAYVSTVQTRECGGKVHLNVQVLLVLNSANKMLFVFKSKQDHPMLPYESYWWFQIALSFSIGQTSLFTSRWVLVKLLPCPCT